MVDPADPACRGRGGRCHRILSSAGRLLLIVASGTALVLCGLALGFGLAVVALTVRLQDWLDGA